MRPTGGLWVGFMRLYCYLISCSITYSLPSLICMHLTIYVLLVPPVSFQGLAEMPFRSKCRLTIVIFQIIYRRLLRIIYDIYSHKLCIIIPFPIHIIIPPLAPLSYTAPPPPQRSTVQQQQHYSQNPYPTTSPSHRQPSASPNASTTRGEK